MLFKLAINNIKKSYKDYLIYFLTITISIGLFYMFNSMESQKAMLVFDGVEADSIDVLIGSLSYVSNFLTFVIAFLMVYANQFLIRRRKKELGIYMTLGMNRMKISMILFIETLLTGVVSLIVGIAIGFIGSHFLSILTAKMFLVDLKEFRFIFSPEATIKSIIAFGIIFSVMMVLNTFNMIKVKLINLLYGKKNQRQKIKNPYIAVVLFILSLITLGYAYYCITINGMLSINTVFAQAIIFGIIGSFLFFMSLAPILFGLIKKRKKVFYFQLNMFSLRQIYSKVNTTYVLMAIISIMLLIAIGTFATGNGTASVINDNLLGEQPFDISLTLYGETLTLDPNDLPGEHHILTEFYSDVKMNELISGDIYTMYFNKDLDFNVTCIRASEFNNMMVFSERTPIDIKKDEYVILYDYAKLDSYYNTLTEKELIIGGETLQLKEIKKMSLVNHYQTTEFAILILPDHLAGAFDVGKFYINTYTDKEEDYRIALNSYVQNSKDGVSYRVDVKDEIIAASLSMSVMVTYISIYVGIVFIMASVVILSLQQLSEASDNASRYQLLKKLGVEEKQIKHSILVQISTYFLLPLVLAIVHSSVGINVSSKVVTIFGNLDVFKNVLVTSAFVLAIYGSYFVVTYITIKSMVLNNR